MLDSCWVALEKNPIFHGRCLDGLFFFQMDPAAIIQRVLFDDRKRYGPVLSLYQSEQVSSQNDISPLIQQSTATRTRFFSFSNTNTDTVALFSLTRSN